MTQQFIFRPITREDFPQLSKWLSTLHVQQWREDDKPDLDWLEESRLRSYSWQLLPKSPK